MEDILEEKPKSIEEVVEEVAPQADAEVIDAEATIDELPLQADAGEETQATTIVAGNEVDEALDEDANDYGANDQVVPDADDGNIIYETEDAARQSSKDVSMSVATGSLDGFGR